MADLPLWSACPYAARQSAVDDEGGARHPGGLVRGEVDDRVGYVLWPAQPPERVQVLGKTSRLVGIGLILK